MTDLETLLYQTFREALALGYTIPPEDPKEPASLTAPDIFRFLAGAVPYTERPTQDEIDDAYHDGFADGEEVYDEGYEDAESEARGSVQYLYDTTTGDSSFTYTVCQHFGVTAR